MTSLLIKAMLAPIVFYQNKISPGLPRRCRYHPTCSQYAVDALRAHGALKGMMLASWRIIRCNPWSRGGVDYVPEKGKWRSPQWVPPEDWVGHDIEVDVLRKNGSRRASIVGNGDNARKVREVTSDSQGSLGNPSDGFSATKSEES